MHNNSFMAAKKIISTVNLLWNFEILKANEAILCEHIQIQTDSFENKLKIKKKICASIVRFNLLKKIEKELKIETFVWNASILF